MTTEISTKVLEALVIEFCEIHLGAPGAEEFRDYLLKKSQIRQAQERAEEYGLDPQVTERSTRFIKEIESEDLETFYRLKLYLPQDESNQKSVIHLYIGVSDEYPDEIIYIYFQNGEAIFDDDVEEFVHVIISVKIVPLENNYRNEKQLLKTLTLDNRAKNNKVYEFDDFKAWKHR